MHVPRFWRCAAEIIPGDSKARKVSAWGWSDENENHALERAQIIARKIASFVAKKEFPRQRYAYADRALREPVLQEIPDRSGSVSALITRNSYGCKVLNSTQLLMADVDFRRPGEGAGLVGGIKKLFGGSGKHPEEEALLSKVEGWLRTNSGWGIRVYRTFGGARLLVTHQPFLPKDRLVPKFFEAVGTDPQYQKLCAVQDSFRARLSPKPWRCGLKNPPARWPFLDAKQEAAFQQWHEKYEAASFEKSTCRLLAALGSHRIAAELEPLLKLHDAESCREGLLA